MLLIGTLAGINMGQLGPRARAIAETMTTAPASPCRLTGATVFADALTRILSDGALAAQVTEIKVGVTHGRSVIEFTRPNDGTHIIYSGRSVFTGPMPLKTEIGLLSSERGLKIEIGINPDTIRALAAEVSKLAASDKQEKNRE
jgi:hypothetical protein